MKKMYIACFFLVGILFSAAYYASYRFTTKQFIQEESSGYENVQTSAASNMVPAATAGEAVITNRTTYIMESYSINQDEVSQETVDPPLEVLGFNRKQMLDYIKNYMENIEENEKEAGLISFELTAFSEDTVILRKTYYRPEPDYLFYLGVQMGRLVVYYTDDDELYAYTEIKFDKLPEELKREILKGKYIESVEELYEFLESYSS